MNTRLQDARMLLEIAGRALQCCANSPTFWWIEHITVRETRFPRPGSERDQMAGEDPLWLQIELRTLNVYELAWNPPCTISIDVERQYIECDIGSSYHLFGRTDLCGEILPILAFTAPLTFSLWPTLIGIRGYYALRERIESLSRHDRSLLEALRGKLDPVSWERLRLAILNSRPVWNGEAYPPGYEPVTS